MRYIFKLLLNKYYHVMKRISLFAMLGVVLLCLTVACNVPMNKDGYVKGFVSFVEEVETKGANYTLKDWEKADDRFENYTEDYYERFADRLTPADQKTLGRCAARYAKARAASSLKGLSDDIEDGVNFMEGYMEQMGENVQNDVDQMMQQMEDDWDDDTD